MHDPEESLAEGLTKEGGFGRMGALPCEELLISKMYDPEESLAEGLPKEGGVRPNGRLALRRINNE